MISTRPLQLTMGTRSCSKSGSSALGWTIAADGKAPATTREDISNGVSSTTRPDRSRFTVSLPLAANHPRRNHQSLREGVSLGAKDVPARQASPWRRSKVAADRGLERRLGKRMSFEKGGMTSGREAGRSSWKSVCPIRGFRGGGVAPWRHRVGRASTSRREGALRGQNVIHPSSADTLSSAIHGQRPSIGSAGANDRGSCERNLAVFPRFVRSTSRASAWRTPLAQQLTWGLLGKRRRRG